MNAMRLSVVCCGVKGKVDELFLIKEYKLLIKAACPTCGRDYYTDFQLGELISKCPDNKDKEFLKEAHIAPLEET